MSSRREVLIRILALLRRKTLIETKNRTLKCLKRHSSTVRSMKNVAVWTVDGAFALFFRSHLGRFDSLRFPTPGNLPSKAKQNANARGSARAAITWRKEQYYLAFLRSSSIMVDYIKSFGRDQSRQHKQKAVLRTFDVQSSNLGFVHRHVLTTRKFGLMLWRQ